VAEPLETARREEAEELPAATPVLAQAPVAQTAAAPSAASLSAAQMEELRRALADLAIAQRLLGAEPG
jgi:hypothetical protein